MKRNSALLLVAVLSSVAVVLVYLVANRQGDGSEPPAVSVGNEAGSHTAAEQPGPGDQQRKMQERPSEVSDSDAHAVSESPRPALEPEIRGALEEILNTSSEGLVEEDMNGSVGVNLQGRFRTAPVATINEQGEVEITDYTHLPQQ